MAFLNAPINYSDLPEEDGFDVLPAGDYNAVIKQAELNETKAGTGQYIKLRLDITGPTGAGRVVFTNLNIQNPNPTAESIGRKQLGVIMKAAGVAQLQDTDQIVGASVGIRLVIDDNPTYGKRNEVKGFKAVGAAPAPSFVNPANGMAPPAAVSGGSTPPWAS